MLHYTRLLIFMALTLLAILNSSQLYFLEIKIDFIEYIIILSLTLSSVILYLTALLRNQLITQTITMRILFWTYTLLLFASIFNRTLDYLNNTLYLEPLINSALYLAIVLLCVFDGNRLYYSHKQESTKNSIQYIKKNKKSVNYKKNTKKTNTKEIKLKAKNTKIQKNNTTNELSTLKRVGPKIQEILYENNIKTYEDIINTSHKDIEEILKNSEVRSYNPKKWQKEAKAILKKKEKQKAKN